MKTQTLALAAVLTLALAVLVLALAAKVDRISKADCPKCSPPGLLATMQAIATETEKEYHGTPTPTPEPLGKTWTRGTLTPRHVVPQNSL